MVLWLRTINVLVSEKYFYVIQYTDSSSNDDWLFTTFPLYQIFWVWNFVYMVSFQQIPPISVFYIECAVTE